MHKSFGMISVAVYFLNILNVILLSFLEMVISRKLILFLNSSSITKCILGVKILNVFIIILYLLHCFGKLRECHQHT